MKKLLVAASVVGASVAVWKLNKSSHGAAARFILITRLAKLTGKPPISGATRQMQWTQIFMEAADKQDTKPLAPEDAAKVNKLVETLFDNWPGYGVEGDKALFEALQKPDGKPATEVDS